MIIYTAGAIDLADGFLDWRQILQDELARLKIPAVIFDPRTAFKTTEWGKPYLDRSKYIECINNAAIISATIVVFLMFKSISSIGTPIELDLAFKHKKDIYLITDIEEGTSVYLDTRVNTNNRFIVHNNIEAIKGTLKIVAETMAWSTDNDASL